jgi:phosphoribosylformylglycinamidine cyclo-ligase
MKNKKITYSQSGVNYQDLDPIKKMAQDAGHETAKNLRTHHFSEIEDSRGESAYVWKQGNVYMASVIEGLGTKNLVADAMRSITGKTYYNNIGYDTIAAIINDLISVGAIPLVVHAYWAIGDSDFLSDKKRMRDLISGWAAGCNSAGASWGGGETPTYKGIINPKTIDLGGSAVGIITSKKNLITDKKLKAGDRIVLVKSTGINVNGLSLARAVAQKLPKKYATKLPSGKMYGESLLTKSNIYAKLVDNLQKGNIDIHYLSNITGHGLRKIMRARPLFSYVIEKIVDPPEIFPFIQKHAGLTDEEMYSTFNMGADYAIFVPEKDVKKTLTIIKATGFRGLLAGYIEKGEKQVIIKQKNIIYKAKTLDLR